jgi:MFS family permease
MAAAFWLVGYAIALATSMEPGALARAVLMLLGILSACAEAAYVSSFQPWLFETVPEDESTRVSAMSNVCSSAGLSLGPSMAVLLVSTGMAWIHR